MRLTGKDVFAVAVKMCWASGPYDPRTNGIAARADALASLLNERMDRRENWLPDLIERVTGRWPGTSCQKQGWCIRTGGERRPQIETVRTLVRLRARLRAWSMGCCGSIIGDTPAA